MLIDTKGAHARRAAAADRLGEQKDAKRRRGLEKDGVGAAPRERAGHHEEPRLETGGERRRRVTGKVD
jgi:hypothetical protein